MRSIENQVAFQAQAWIWHMIAGALAGMAASVPMGLAMIGLNRWLPHRKPAWMEGALPPKQITTRMAKRTGAEEFIEPGRSWGIITWLSHLGYGAAAASLYPLISWPIPLPGMLRGMLFATSVWAGSYLGWLPAANILPPATALPARRNTVMILSHLLWGALISLFVRAMKIDR